MSRSAQIKFIVVLVLVLMLLIVGIQNRYQIDLKLFFWTVPMNGAFLFLLLFGAGVACGMILSWILRRERKSKSGDL